MTNEAAVGYLGMGYAGDRTRSIRVSKAGGEFFPPTVEEVKAKRYPLARGLYFYTDGDPKGAVKLFVDFSLGPEGQRHFENTGFVPLGATGAQTNQ